MEKTEHVTGQTDSDTNEAGRVPPGRTKALKGSSEETGMRRWGLWSLR